MKDISLPMFSEQDNAPCCGPPPPPPSEEYEKAGYSVNRFVQTFINTRSGKVPKVSTKLTWYDLLGTIRVRLGFFREAYRVAPGLYCVGIPDSDSPVLITANYKLSFDTLRKNIAGLDVWILVLDTRGINVWCASAHKTFGTDELVRQIELSNLAKTVNHRKLIVPQLGASGVNGWAVKKRSGFDVVWGPIRSTDIEQFLSNGNKITPEMRKLTFTISERLILAPVEITLAFKPAIISLTLILVLSGVGPKIFSITAAWQRGQPAALSLLAGLFGGAVIMPAFLPWLPFREFYLKGILSGIPMTLLILYFTSKKNMLEMVAITILCLTVSSFSAMNYTGATPFASPSGVEKEMRHAIPVQIILLLIASVMWIVQPFL